MLYPVEIQTFNMYGLKSYIYHNLKKWLHPTKNRHIKVMFHMIKKRSVTSYTKYFKILRY